MGTVRTNIVADVAAAELHSLLESLWSMRDAGDDVPLDYILAVQAEADEWLAEWAARQGIPCSTPEERADALVELRTSNAERMGLMP